jgi:hypothetical protein
MLRVSDIIRLMQIEADLGKPMRDCRRPTAVESTAMALTTILLDERAKLLRLQAREGEAWEETVERNRAARPDWTIELYVMPASAPEATRDRRGRKLEPVRIVVHTWAPGADVTVEEMEVSL